jgi:hypothetical protein
MSRKITGLLCFGWVDRVLGGAYMGFTGGGAVVLLCGLVFPDKRIAAGFLCWGIFAAERGIFWPGGVVVSCGLAWADAGSLTIWF